jgi:hypothetical protein
MYLLTFILYIFPELTATQHTIKPISEETHRVKPQWRSPTAEDGTNDFGAALGTSTGTMEVVTQKSFS